MPTSKIHASDTIAKRMLWLAWQACGGPLGMGVLQDRSGVTEEDVWANVHDGPFGGDIGRVVGPAVVIGGTEPGRIYADYVFGRMMKFRVSYTPEGVDYSNSPTPRPDYQSWYGKYPTYQSLYEAAVASLNQ